MMDALLGMTSRVAVSPYTTLNCDECSVVLMRLMDVVKAGDDPEFLWRALQRHLARCPDCRERHLRHIDELEAYLVERSKHSVWPPRLT